MKPAPTHSVSPKFEARYSFDGLRFEEVRYDASLYRPFHTHEEVFLDYCLEGTIQEFWDKRTFVRGPSTLNFLPIGASHANHFPEVVRTFQIVLPAVWFERVRQKAAILDTLTSYQGGPPAWIVARMYREFRRRDNVTPLALEGMLLELLAEMSRQSTNCPENGSPRWLGRATDYLHAHFSESVSVEDIATAVGVHPSHLMRSFRRHHRCTIGDYMRRLRVEAACSQLSTPDAAPSQVAIRVGFADQSHFNRTFKSYMGITPTEYQKVSGHASIRQEVIL